MIWRYPVVLPPTIQLDKVYLNHIFPSKLFNKLNFIETLSLNVEDANIDYHNSFNTRYSLPEWSE